MSVHNSSGLASLTATYTDSEGEDEAGEVSSPSPEKNTPVPPAVASAALGRTQVRGNQTFLILILLGIFMLLRCFNNFFYSITEF